MDLGWIAEGSGSITESLDFLPFLLQRVKLLLNGFPNFVWIHLPPDFFGHVLCVLLHSLQLWTHVLQFGIQTVEVDAGADLQRVEAQPRIFTGFASRGKRECLLFTFTQNRDR